MAVAVPLTVHAGFIRAQLGRFSLDRFNRQIGLTAWRSQLGVNSRQGEVKPPPVLDLFTIQVMAGLEQSQPWIFFVESAHLPENLSKGSLDRESICVGFTGQLLREKEANVFEWSGGVGLSQTGVSIEEGTSLLSKLVTRAMFSRDLTLDKTLLVNLSNAAGGLRTEAELIQQMVRLARA